jgi:hypothetical protein
MEECGYEFVGQEAAKDGAFVDRLTRVERARRKALDAARGAAEYKYKVGKKVCPSCGAVQSYEETQDRKRGKKCQECHVAYRVPRPKDSKGVDAWLAEQAAQHEEQKARATREALERAAAADRRRVGGADSVAKAREDAYQRALRAKVDAEAGPFMDRLKDDIDRRRNAAKARESLAFSAADADCTFKPALAKGRAAALDVGAAKRVAAASSPRDAPVVAKWEDDLEAYLKAAAAARAKTLSRDLDAAGRAARPGRENARPGGRPKSKTAPGRQQRKRDKSPVDAAPVDLGAFEDLI